MPGVTLHFILARTALDSWRSGGSPAPFDFDDPELLTAFRHGSIGPDLGYFPGGKRVLSELAHTMKTGALTRTLVETARTPMEMAFAWGWLTHVLGDTAIHPLIGRAVGHETRGSYDHFVDGATDPLTHLRVEVGLDAWCAARYPEECGVRLDPIFDSQSVLFLSRAFSLTYGLDIPKRDFLRSHQAIGSRASQSLATLWIVGSLMKDPARRVPLPGVRHLLSAAYRSTRLRGVALAYVNPIMPSDWLLIRVARAIQRFRQRFDEFTRNGLDALGDDNLDTGLPIVAVENPGAREAIRAPDLSSDLSPSRASGLLVEA